MDRRDDTREHRCGKTASTASFVMAYPVANNGRHMRSIKVSDLLGIQDKGPGALVQIDCGRDRIAPIAYHPRRILDSEIDRNWLLYPPDALLQLVFQALPTERPFLRDLPGM